MAKKRALKPGERRCSACDSIIKDKLHSITSPGDITAIINNTNGYLSSVMWLMHINTNLHSYTIVKLILRKKKNKTLYVDEWWEAELIVQGAVSTNSLVEGVKKFWSDHPLDTFTKEAIKYHTANVAEELRLENEKKKEVRK